MLGFLKGVRGSRNHAETLVNGEAKNPPGVQRQDIQGEITPDCGLDSICRAK